MFPIQSINKAKAFEPIPYRVKEALRCDKFQQGLGGVLARPRTPSCIKDLAAKCFAFHIGINGCEMNFEQFHLRPKVWDPYSKKYRRLKGFV